VPTRGAQEKDPDLATMTMYAKGKAMAVPSAPWT
jgi:hypothetical protein